MTSEVFVYSQPDIYHKALHGQDLFLPDLRYGWVFRDLQSSFIDQNTAITTPPPCPYMPEGVPKGQNKIRKVSQSQSKTDPSKQVIT